VEYRTRSKKNSHDGLITDPQEGETLLRHFAAHHLDVHTSKGRPLSPKTLGPMRGLLNRNIVGNDRHRKRHHLGGYPLNKITVDVVDDWYAKVITDAGADQAAKSYKLLKTILNRAVRYRWIPFNPCQIEGGGQEHPAERPIPEDDDVVQALADAMDQIDHGSRYKAMVLVNGFGAALRTEELVGLRRRDMKIHNFSVKIRGTKNEEADRTIYLPDRGWEALMEHMATYMPTGPDALPDDLVFTSPRGGVLHPQRFSAVWQQAKAKVGVDPDLRLYDLRHYAGTVMAQEGVTTKEIMAHMGHKTERMAMHYQKATDRRAQENRQRLSRRYASQLPDPEPTNTDNVIPIRRRAN
jgi:integrase